MSTQISGCKSVRLFSRLRKKVELVGDRTFVRVLCELSTKMNGMKTFKRK